MRAPSPVVLCYQELELIASQMLDAAQGGNWDAMTELQQVYLAHVERLRGMHTDAPITEHERAERFQLLERILAYDAAIRNLLMPQMARLAALLNSSRQQRGLHHAYGVPA